MNFRFPRVKTHGAIRSCGPRLCRQARHPRTPGRTVWIPPGWPGMITSSMSGKARRMRSLPIPCSTCFQEMVSELTVNIPELHNPRSSRQEGDYQRGHDQNCAPYRTGADIPVRLFRMRVSRNISGGSVSLSAVTESGKDPGETRTVYISPLNVTKIKNLLLWV